MAEGWGEASKWQIKILLKNNTRQWQLRTSRFWKGKVITCYHII